MADPRPSDVTDRELVESLQRSFAAQCVANTTAKNRVAKFQTARLRGRLLCRLARGSRSLECEHDWDRGFCADCGAARGRGGE